MMKWMDAKTAPKDGTQFLSDVGYPWPVMTVWNEHDGRFVFAELSACSMDNNTTDVYFETEWCDVEVKKWMRLPEVEQ